jgi:FkbM family methyltransferase
MMLRTVSSSARCVSLIVLALVIFQLASLRSSYGRAAHEHVRSVVTNAGASTLSENNISDRVLNSCGDPRLLTLLPPLHEILEEFDNYDSDTEPWPPAFQCSPLEIFGGKPAYIDPSLIDGDKAICGLRQMRSPCSIYSLGSNLDFSFERAVSNASNCDIVTADCTVDNAKAISLLPPRTRFFNLCLGSAGARKLVLSAAHVSKKASKAKSKQPIRVSEGRGHASKATTKSISDTAKPQIARSTPVYVTLATLMNLSGHTHIDLLKMDIEGFENAVLEGLLAVPRESRLPYQISIETHGGERAAWAIRALLVLGYIPVSKQQNPQWAGAWEWTLVRAYCDLSAYIDITRPHPRQKLLVVPPPPKPLPVW